LTGRRGIRSGYVVGNDYVSVDPLNADAPTEAVFDAHVQPLVAARLHRPAAAAVLTPVLPPLLCRNHDSAIARECEGLATYARRRRVGS